MRRFNRLTKLIALATCGGMFWMWGAGSCVPYNFYAGLLGNTIVAGFVGTIVNGIAAKVVLPQGT